MDVRKGAHLDAPAENATAEVLLFGAGSNNSNSGTSDDNRSSHQWHLSQHQVMLSVTALVLLFFVSMAANLGIIFYERTVSDIYRTLLNKLAALASLYQVGLTVVVFPVLVARLLWGDGLGRAVCTVHILLFVFILTQFVLTYNELIFLRYIYICKLGAVGVLKEEAIFCFCIWINILLGTFVSLSSVLVMNSPSNAYYHYCQNSENTNG